MATLRTTHSLDDGRITFKDSAETTYKDPVCKMEVVPEAQDTKRWEHGGKTYFFCSEDCRDNFVADPTRFEPN